MKHPATSEVCVDVETSGLDFKRNHIIGYVCTFGPAPQDSYYLPFRHLGNANVGGRNGPTTPFNWDRKLAPEEKELLGLLDQRHRLLFGHNFGFDLRFMHNTGAFNLEPRCEDTIINEPLLNEWAGKFSLEACANRRGVQAKKSEQTNAYLCDKFAEARAKPKQAMGYYWRLPGDDPVAVEYAEGDGTTTWQLRDVQLPLIRKADTFQGVEIPSLERVWDIESRLIPVLTRMTVKGIKIDEEALSKLKAHIKSNLERLANTFPSGFEARSNDRVREWMEQHGHTDWPLTATGKPSFVQGWLENHEAGRQVIEMRKYETLRDTFVMPLESSHMHKGRVHATYNQLRGDEYGTITGRLSCTDPNLQAVPKHDDETRSVPLGPLYRRLFVPDEGQTWGSADYNQCEPRLLAVYSGCRALIEGYMADPPRDSHTTAAVMMNRNWDRLSKAEQKNYRNMYAKRINQTIITGGGKNVIVTKYKVPADEVDEAWNSYHRAMPEIRVIQKQMQRRMQMRGYLLTLLGRRCRLRDPDKAYVALNRALQGGNADIIKLKLVEMDEYLRSVGRPLDLLNNIHDDVAFQFPTDARKAFDQCIAIMQNFGPQSTLPLSLPLPVDVGLGKDWGAATYGEH